MDRRDCLHRGLVALAGAGAMAPAHSATPWVIEAVELPPLVMATPTGSTGVLVEVVRLLCQRLNLPAQIRVVPWARAYADTLSGQSAALMPAIRSAERERLFHFPSEPLYQAEMSFFKRADQALTWSGQLADLKDLHFVKLKGALFAPEFDAAVAQGRLHCEEANSFAAAVRMVNAGRVHLAAIPKLAGLQIAASEGLQGRVLPLEPRVHLQPLYLALTRVGEPAAWVDRIGAALAQLHREGAVRDIVEQYRQRQWLPGA